ncbi:MAG: HAD family phosphatase [Verrucomicrobia bacterium]|nr:HAD family phosphatase [Verrucomicrobiota bacterium]MBS0637697.1 HAD family phosphatase [Verrucomicrobiota bacterium]
MKYQAIIFDMDGTITDSERLWDKATDSLLSKHNVSLSHEERALFGSNLQGTSLLDATIYMKKAFSLSESVENLMHEYAGYAHTLMCSEVRFIESFLQFFHTLDSHNLKYGIATNADALTLSAQKKALSLDSLFGEHIYNVDHVTHGKPHPDLYLLAASKLNISPYACIAVEDSACGIKAAKAANMFCIGINSHGNLEQLKEADMVINSYRDVDLPKLLSSV